MMLKVIIVDDEILVRVGLKSAVNWGKYDMQVVAEASNGNDALEVIKQFIPDMVITDIRMPGMDGIALIKEIRQINDSVKIVILSCYDDFHYAKEAIKFGVSEYILKPTMLPNDLEDVVSRIANLIKSEMKKEDESEVQNRQISLNMPILREKFLIKLLDDVFYNSSEIDQEIEKLGLGFLRHNIFVICISIDNFYSHTESYEKRDIQLLLFAISNISEEIIRMHAEGIVFNKGDNEIACIVTFVKEPSQKLILEKIKSITDGILGSVRKYLNITITIGVSRRNATFSIKKCKWLGCSSGLRHVCKLYCSGAIYAIF